MNYKNKLQKNNSLLNIEEESEDQMDEEEIDLEQKAQQRLYG